MPKSVSMPLEVGAFGDPWIRVYGRRFPPMQALFATYLLRKSFPTGHFLPRFQDSYKHFAEGSPSCFPGDSRNHPIPCYGGSGAALRRPLNSAAGAAVCPFFGLFRPQAANLSGSRERPGPTGIPSRDAIAEHTLEGAPPRAVCCPRIPPGSEGVRRFADRHTIASSHPPVKK